MAVKSADLKSIDMIRRLVAFDTTSRNSNLDLIAYVQGYLEDLGVESLLVHDETGAKANLYATLGPDDRPGICLSGHTDVVPVDGQAWDTDPFSVTERDGRLYGRGTCDMKSFIAAALAMAPEFLACGLRTPIHLALSYDEEVGCIGVRTLLARFPDMPVRPRGCIVGEPTSMDVVNGHKGKFSTRVHVHGHECHSALAPEGVNAIEYAAQLIAFIHELAREKQENGPFDGDYDVAHSTVHTGLVGGGTALNIVPKHCWFDFEIRHIAEDDPEALAARIREYGDTVLLPRMKAVSADAGIEWEPPSLFPGFDIPVDDEIIQFAKSLTGANSTRKVAFGTEAGLFQQVDVPTVICGPGSIDQAHKPNEYITLEEVARCEAFMGRLMERLSAA